eukprot:1249172-Prymnesium_polylepis.1
MLRRHALLEKGGGMWSVGCESERGLAAAATRARLDACVQARAHLVVRAQRAWSLGLGLLERFLERHILRWRVQEGKAQL